MQQGLSQDDDILGQFLSRSIDTIRPEQIQPNSKTLANRFEGRKNNLISLKYIGGDLNGNYQGE